MSSSAISACRTSTGSSCSARARAGSGARRKSPAIALTAFARSEDRTRALRAGFLVHVSKPSIRPNSSRRWQAWRNASPVTFDNVNPRSDAPAGLPARGPRTCRAVPASDEIVIDVS